MRILLILLGIWATCLGEGVLEPEVVYLTWTDDPTSTMTIQWHTPSGANSKEVSYRSIEKNGWLSVQGDLRTLEDVDIEVHLAHIKGLKEDSLYVFKIQGSSKEYRFRTMPKTLSRPIRMVIGGDAFHRNQIEVFRRMNRVIFYNEPDFVVIGGDIAYTTGHAHLLKGSKWELARWQIFLKELQKTVKGKDGRLIPILPIVGNHDVHHTYEPGKRELFYDIFAFPEDNKAYRALKFGNYLSLVMLDTDHTWPVEGKQTDWLARALEQNQDVSYLFAAYHVAAYPSHYPYEGKIPEKIRSHWVPLFEKYEVPFVFEHHNHAFKRTHPLKNGKIDPTGVTYLGDGAWAVPPRAVKSPNQEWYLLKSQSVNLCYFVTMTEEACTIEAKNLKNEVIDQVSAKPKVLSLAQ